MTMDPWRGPAPRIHATLLHSTAMVVAGYLAADGHERPSARGRSPLLLS